MISFKHVYKSYATQAPCLKDLNFHDDKGDFVFVVGPSGSGKTTLFKLISAYETKTSGEIEVLGHNLNSLRQGQIPFLRRKIGFVLQNYKLLKNKTVFENIELPLVIQNVEKPLRAIAVDRIIEMVGLTHLKDQYPDFLSGGEQQRTAIARALVHNPEIVIADEPTGNLDFGMSQTIMQIFRRFSEQGLTILMATHDQRLINQANSRVFSIEQGHINEGELR